MAKPPVPRETEQGNAKCAIPTCAAQGHLEHVHAHPDIQTFQPGSRLKPGECGLCDDGHTFIDARDFTANAPSTSESPSDGGEGGESEGVEAANG